MGGARGAEVGTGAVGSWADRARLVVAVCSSGLIVPGGSSEVESGARGRDSIRVRRWRTAFRRTWVDDSATTAGGSDMEATATRPHDGGSGVRTIPWDTVCPMMGTDGGTANVRAAQ